MKYVVLIIFQIFIFCSLSIESSAQISSDSLLRNSLHEVKDNIHNEDYRSAMDNIRKIFKLKITLPDEVAYWYGVILVKEGEYVKGKEALEKYIELQGVKGEHYASAVDYLRYAEASICKKCNNTNIVYEDSTCHECSGDGHNSVYCRNCGGLGKSYCKACNGSGITRSGSGFNELFLSCSRCNSTGIAECRYCSGTGEIKTLCKICRGEGKKIHKRNCTH